MKRTQVFLPDPMIQALKQISTAKGVSVAEVIRRAVEDHLEKINNGRAESSNPRGSEVR